MITNKEKQLLLYTITRIQDHRETNQQFPVEGVPITAHRDNLDRIPSLSIQAVPLDNDWLCKYHKNISWLISTSSAYRVDIANGMYFEIE
jgi:hypothetical protein